MTPKAIKPFITVVKPGQVWECSYQDPFMKPSRMKILRVKGEYVQYCFMPECGMTWSDSADLFARAKLISEEDDRGKKEGKK